MKKIDKAKEYLEKINQRRKGAKDPIAETEQAVKAGRDPDDVVVIRRKARKTNG